MRNVLPVSTQLCSYYFQGKNDQALPDNLPRISMEQTHSANVSEITAAETQKIADTDGIFTELPNVLLKVKHADCLPVLIYHPKPLVAALHAGRKGTEQKILQKFLQFLKDEKNIQDCLEIWFGPAICVDCYQIDRETDLHYDLLDENTKQVRTVFSETKAKIRYADRCTAHENLEFYSYRKEGKGVPMNWSGIVLTDAQT